jgi:hypothetical protein
VKTEYDYGDLEAVAKKVMDLVYEHAEELTWESGWNRARVLTESVQSVAFPD